MEGWYTLHDVYRVNGERWPEPGEQIASAVANLNREPDWKGWSCVVELVGGPGDFLAIHVRERVEDLYGCRAAISSDTSGVLERAVSMLGLTEAGLYHLTAELARDAVARGGSVGDDQYVRELAARSAAERDTEHVRKRLYPPFPADMPYVSFYPMSKRRAADQNWYALTLDERSALMQAHGRTGRRYAGRVLQIISGSIGLADWEWGVTLFARDLLDIKKLVTDMRFDEVSARYADFGSFHVGKVV